MNSSQSKILPIALAAVSIVFAGTNAEVHAQGWPGYAHDAQHTCVSSVQSQPPQTIRWSAPVDLQPQYSGNDLFIHYGSPVITQANTVIVPVKTGASDGFEVRAYYHPTGAGSATLVWTLSTDYSVPSYSWTPVCGVTLTPLDSALVAPAAGGTVLVRSTPNSASGTTTRLAFHGLANYNFDPTAFNSAIKICTPISSDDAGNLYFGYISTGAALPGYPSGIPSGLARISSSGVGSFVAAEAMSGDAGSQTVLYNCAPAVSADGSTLYVAVSNIPVGSPNNWGSGYLCALNSATLARMASVFLNDPRPGVGAASVINLASATPTVGPDGDVYFGVLEGNFPSNHDRGWLLHYSSSLATTKTPGAFGWDDTASIVPVSAVPSYSGPSSYLLLTKYNNYASVGGDGVNKLALVDPNVTMTDPITGATVMNTVLTVAGVTPDEEYVGSFPNAVREWCINSAAIDVVNKCAVVNSEDGKLYRWDFSTNSLSTGLTLAPPTGEAYTPTVIGPDGAVYAINNATLFSAGTTSVTVPALPAWGDVVLPSLLALVAGGFLRKTSQRRYLIVLPSRKRTLRT
ncbi:MAG: hypothetical protein WCF18_19270 [Chthoniobacteraceae bacterium]